MRGENRFEFTPGRTRTLLLGAALSSLALGSYASGQCCAHGEKTRTLTAAADINDAEAVGASAAFESMRLVEGRINAFTSSTQGNATLAASPSGDFLVAWDSRRQERGTYGVVGQYFDALGRRVGSEFRLNDFAKGGQTDPAIAFDNDGSAWGVWQSDFQDGNRSGIILRKFGVTADGSFGPVADEIIVNQHTQGDQLDPTIAVNSDNEVLVAWRTTRDDGKVVARARLFNAQGEPTTNEFDLAEADGRMITYVSAAATADGRFLAAWSGIDAEAMPGSLHAAFVTAEGVSPSFTLAEGASGVSVMEPSLGVDAKGRIVAAWVQVINEAQDASVMARVFNADGSPLSKAVEVAHEGEWMSGASIAVQPDGRFLVSYNVHEAKTTVENDGRLSARRNGDIYAREFDASGAPLGEPMQVNGFATGQQMLVAGSNAVRTAWTTDGRYAAAWIGDTDGDGSGIALSVYSPMEMVVAEPAPVEALAAGSDLTHEQVAPPDFNPDWVPQDPELDLAAAGPDFGFLSFQTTPWQPPDPDLAVGPEHIVTVVNMEIKVHLKDGTEVFHQLLEDFFRPVGANNFVFDPVAVYDRFSDRFVIATAEHNGSLDILNIAVTQTSNPLDGWHKYGVNVDSVGGFVDFENLGVGEEAYYITADYFGGGGNVIHIFEKAPMLVGDPVTLRTRQTSSSLLSTASVNSSYDASAPAQYFGTAWNSSNNHIRLYALRDPLGARTLNSFELPVPGYSQPPDAVQLGSSNRLDTIDYRIKHGVYRNGRLYLVHTIGENNTARVRWYEIEMNGWPASGSNPSLVQSGTINPGAGQYSWFPDIGVSDDGDIVITCSRSSSADYPFISRFVHKAGDPAGTVRTESRLKESDSFHTGGRWGDYSGLDEDPVDPGVFWSHNEYNQTGTNWRTWVGRVDSDKSMVLSIDQIVRGQQSNITVAGAAANSTVYLGYSRTGLGSTNVPFLNVTVDLANPQLATTAVSNSNGDVNLTLPIPNGLATGPIWVQAAEVNNTSNVYTGTVN